MTKQTAESARFSVLSPDQALVEGSLGALEQQVETCLTSGRTRVTVDLGAVPFIDSRGLELLLQSARRLRAAGGRLRLANPNPLCSEILLATRLDREIEVVFDLDQAGRSLR